MFICIAISFLISISLVPVVLHFCEKKGLYDTTNERKIHSGNIPRLGAVGFVPAFSVGAFIFLALNHSEKGMDWSIIALVAAGLLIFIFGILDDIIEMGGKQKLLVQIVASALVLAFNFRFQNILGLDLGIFSYPLTFCWIIGVINAFNLIDGMDGLCGGLSCIISIGFGFLFYKYSPELASLGFILAAAILGFLVYNKPKAKIFMGDGGSQFLGFMMAVLPLYQTEGIAKVEQVKFPLVIVLCLIPLMDTIAAMWRRTREHRSFFSPDRSHLHHKFLNMGFTVPQILLTLYSFQVFLCIIAYISLFIGGKRAVLVLFIGFCATTIMFTIIHYVNKSITEKIKKLNPSEE